MKILMLSWEFPPKVVGGIAPHVHDLSLSLLEKGQEVSVLTIGTSEAVEKEKMKGVEVYRVKPSNPSPPDFLTWVLQFNLNLAEKAITLSQAGIEFDLIHAHDWLVAYAGKLLKHALNKPLVATIHATEWGRNNGLHNDLQRYISDVEWWLAFEAWRVICCSRYMFAELQTIFQVPKDKLRIIPNGVYPELFRKKPENADLIRNQFAAPNEKVVFYIGRLVFEKGLDLLLEVATKILSVDDQVKFVIAGKGPYAENLQNKARQLGIYHKVYFTGYIDDLTRNALFSTADVAVFPSLYEPFGIVALEAMAAGTPVVVSDTGGLGEVVRHGKNGLKALTNNSDSLADNILWMLSYPEHAKAMKEQAYRDLETEYNWGKIAEQTAEVYQEVENEYLKSFWSQPYNEKRYQDDGLKRERLMEANTFSRYTPGETATIKEYRNSAAQELQPTRE